MAVVVEDGTGVTSSNAYGAVVDAQAYYDEMGYTDTATAATVIRGARTLDALKVNSLKGAKVSAAQSMIWPRISVTDEDGNAVDDDVVPVLWVRASYEMARIVPTDQSFSPALFIGKVKAGSVEVDFDGVMVARQVLTFVEELIAPYLSSRDLVRA